MDYGLTTPRSNISAMTIGDYVLFAGGNTNSGYSDVVDIFKLENGEIQRVVSNKYNLNTKRSVAIACRLDGYGFFIGNQDVNDHSNTIDVYSIHNGELIKEISSLLVNIDSAGSFYNKFYQGTKIGNHIVCFDKFGTASSISSSATEYFDVLDTNVKREDNILSLRNAVDKKDLNTAIRLTTDVISTLEESLISDGVDGLLTYENQQLKEYNFDTKVTNQPINQLDFHGSYGIYFQELFFHAPFYIAKSLQENMQYQEAQKWYHYIFNPTKNKVTDPNQQYPYWNYLPFDVTLGDTTLSDMLQDKSAITVYNNNPFDPYAIADIRAMAYQKNVVMSYIDNLLNWGDACFARDGFESIAEATMLYFMALHVLGPKPESKGIWTVPKPESYDDIKESNESIPQFLIELEGSKKEGLNINNVPFNDVNAYFGVPDNKDLVSYWDKVEDRLFKIRHSMNIEGVQRQLSLFAPELDPNQLIRAVANASNGMSPFEVAEILNSNLLPYRFVYLLERAKSLTSTVVQLGSNLLSALEKQDSEKIGLIRASHEKATLNLVLQTKQQQIDEAQATLEGLYQNLDSSQIRRDHYQELIDQQLIVEETESINQANIGTGFNVASSLTREAGDFLDLAPNIFGLADGGSQWGSAARAYANEIDVGSSLAHNLSSQLATNAGYKRREEDWQLQLKIAEKDIEQISKQITAAEVRLQISQHELKTHEESIKQADEVESFLKSKFTNKELYKWMVSRISATYFQSFKLAQDMSLAAQKAYQVELNKKDEYISFDYWNSLKQGLLAGEGLMLGIAHLEKAFITNNKRYLEIEKTISLKQLWEEDAENELDKLRSEKKCNFNLNNDLFELDFPNHYNRRIKSVTITIPGVVGPYQEINATLTQTNNVIGLTPNVDLSTESPDVLKDWMPNQSVALSRGINDSGMFEMNFHDDRYLPFENTGVVSKWELKLSDNTDESILNSITDVIVKIYYIALAK
jgi:hypothetical protein